MTALPAPEFVARFLPATVLQRVGALIVDILLFIVTVMVPATLISWWFGPEEFTTCEFFGTSEVCTTNPEALAFTRQVAYTLALIWLPLYAWTISKGSSIGKRATEAMVIDMETGGTISFGRALARTVLAVVGLVAFGLGLAFMFTNPKRLALHDVLLGTRVIAP
ncbi:MAG: RDD family protein [Ilumatobacter sp.]